MEGSIRNSGSSPVSTGIQVGSGRTSWSSSFESGTAACALLDWHCHHSYPDPKLGLCVELKSLSDYSALSKIHDSHRQSPFTIFLPQLFLLLQNIRSMVHLTFASSKWSYSVMLYFNSVQDKTINTQKSCCIKRLLFHLLHRELI